MLLAACGSDPEPPRDAGRALDARVQRDAGVRADAAAPDAARELDAGASSPRDAFGIAQLYPSAEPRREWTSEHWSGATYAIEDRIDPEDPLALSGRRGTGTLAVDDGVLTMSGSQPRLYVYPDEARSWTNVEVTVYYRRVEDASAAYAGIVIGARSGPDGHTEATPCDAHTYYARLRNDGSADLAKELEHPNAEVGDSTPASELWPEASLPYGTWIGWKLVVFNLPDGSVRFESYRDRSGGEDGGTWEPIGARVDAGDWPAPSSCAAHDPVGGESTFVPREGGAVLIRNTEVTTAEYRWISIREIAPPP
jgi:hypothetical protein